jgi:hypothetical protein
MIKFFDIFLGFKDARRKNNRFPGQQEGELVEYLSVMHWIKLFPFALFICFSLFAIAAFHISIMPLMQFSLMTEFIVYSVALTLLVHLTALKLFNYFMDVLIITNYRIIDVRHTVYLIRERDTISLHNVQDIHFKQSGVWPRLLNYGDLEIYGSNVDVEYRIHHVPDVEKVHSMLCHIHRKAIQVSPRSLVHRGEIEHSTQLGKPGLQAT